MRFYLIIQNFLSNRGALQYQSVLIVLRKGHMHVLFSISESSYHALQYDC